MDWQDEMQPNIDKIIHAKCHPNIDKMHAKATCIDKIIHAKCHPNIDKMHANMQAKAKITTPNIDNKNTI